MPNRGTCLIVEDSAFQAKICEKAIGSLGYDCLTVANASDALRQLSTTGNIRLVLSDINMPGMNGLQLLSQVRMQEALRDLPFIMVTSQSDRATVVQAAQLGCKGFLRKPYTSILLKQKIEQIMGPAESLTARILLVDSSEEECRRLRQSVQRTAPKALQMDFAHSIESAQEMLKQALPDLLLVCQEVDSGQGHELLRWVKEQSAMAGISVVIISQPMPQTVVAQSYQLGATCHLIRTQNTDELATTLANLADVWQARQGTA